MSPALKNAVTPYVSPVFEQTWSLFAPCPLMEQHIRIRYYFEDDTSEWVSPMKSDLEMHSFWRVSHHGELALGEYNLLHFVRSDLEDMGMSVMSPFENDSIPAFMGTSGYWMLYRFIYGTSVKIFHKEPLKADAECTYRNVKTDQVNTILIPDFSWDRKE